MSDLPIIIAGGGIGGLAAACGLARKGYKSIVVEQAPQLGEIGAGIQIGPNAFHCFDYLGVGDEARSKAVYIDSLRLMDAQSAENITSIPLGEDFRKYFKNPYAVVHRADLHGVLLEYCEKSPLIEIRTDHIVTGYEQNGTEVSLFVRGREPIKGRFLIGAEGLRSPIRGQMVGDGEPRISGHTTYRSVIPTDQMPEDLRWNAATLWAGPKCHIVHYPLKGWKVSIWLSLITATFKRQLLVGRLREKKLHKDLSTYTQRSDRLLSMAITGSSGCFVIVNPYQTGLMGA